MKIRVLISSMAIFLSHFLHGQEMFTWYPEEQIHTFSLQLYRAKVMVRPGTASEIKIIRKWMNYDTYSETGELVPIELSGVRRFAPQTAHSIFSLHHEHRELQQLEITLPDHMNLHIQISHLGLVDIKGISGNIHVQCFNGDIDIQGAVKTVSAAMEREGDITVDAHPQKGSSLVLSNFSGDIRLTTPPETRADYRVNSETGKVINRTNMILKKVDPFIYTMKENNQPVEMTSWWLEGKRNQGESIKILIKSVLGNVDIF